MTQLRPFVVLAAIILTYAEGPAGLGLGLLVFMVNELIGLRLRVMAWDGETQRPRWMRWRPRRRRREPFPTFDSVASDVSWATKSGRDFDLHIRRRFTRVASVRLLDLDLDLDTLAENPDRARTLIGPELWAIIDPNRPNSTERSKGGVTPHQLHHLLDQLDAIGQQPKPRSGHRRTSQKPANVGSAT